MSVAAEPGIRRIFVRDLVVEARLGILDWERTRPQRARVSIDLAVHETGTAERLDDVVSYADLRDAAITVLTRGHIDLVETAAERIAAACLADPRSLAVRVRLEKLDVFPDCVVGVEIERVR